MPDPEGPQEQLDYEWARRWWLSWAIVALLLVGLGFSSRPAPCVPIRGFDSDGPLALLFCVDPHSGQPFIIPNPEVTDR